MCEERSEGEGDGEYVERGVRGREMECVGSGVRQMGVWEWSEAEGECESGVRDEEDGECVGSRVTDERGGEERWRVKGVEVRRGM